MWHKFFYAVTALFETFLERVQLNQFNGKNIIVFRFEFLLVPLYYTFHFFPLQNVLLPRQMLVSILRLFYQVLAISP